MILLCMTTDLIWGTSKAVAKLHRLLLLLEVLRIHDIPEADGNVLSLTKAQQSWPAAMSHKGGNT